MRNQLGGLATRLKAGNGLLRGMPGEQIRCIRTPFTGLPSRVAWGTCSGILGTSMSQTPHLPYGGLKGHSTAILSGEHVPKAPYHFGGASGFILRRTSPERPPEKKRLASFRSEEPSKSRGLFRLCPAQDKSEEPERGNMYLANLQPEESSQGNMFPWEGSSG